MSSAHLPLLTSLLIVTTAVAAGPVFGIPSAPTEAECSVDSPIGTGQASVSVTNLPDTATLERSRFGAAAWRLHVNSAHLDVGPVSGRPTVTYKLRVEGQDLGLAAAATAILSRCHDTNEVVIEESQYSPRSLEQDSYEGTIEVTYRGVRGGEDVEQQLATKNITVQVER